MSIKYTSIVPWGRSYEEYIDMFSLTGADLGKNILGCGDGPASFNCRMTKMGNRIISIDPIYQFSSEEIEKRIEITYHDVIDQTKKNKDKFIWSKIKSVEDLGHIRMNTMKEFLNDFEEGKIKKRYIHAELPILPFEDKQFDLSLSSHFLFLYTDNLSLDFHIDSIQEMMRVSNESRIFPLLDVNGNRSSYIEPVITKFKDFGYNTDEVTVDYEFQKSGNRMLIITGKKW